METLPSRLFHYTSLEGLVGIVTSRTFFLSDMLASTDQSEIRYGIDLVREVLEDSKADKLLRNVWRHYSNHELLGIGDSTAVHALCFCAGDDVLTQWRGYSSAGGCAIGVDFPKLMQTANAAGFALGRILYDRDRQVKSIRRAIRCVQELFTAGGSNSEDERVLQEWAGNVGLFLLKSALLFKHEAFVSENEWRVFGLRVPDVRKFRLRGNTITAYVELSFAPLLMTDIRCSPPRLWSPSARHGVEQLAKSLGAHVQVTHSQLPL